jgi:VanZ family protein
MIKKYFLTIVWALIIFVATMVPGKTIPNVPIFGIDKLVHFFIFSMLSFLWLYDLNKNIKSSLASYYVILLSIGYGIFIEIIQRFIPGRSCSIYDIIANSIGVALGYYAFKLVTKKKPKSSLN